MFCNQNQSFIREGGRCSRYRTFSYFRKLLSARRSVKVLNTKRYLISYPAFVEMYVDVLWRFRCKSILDSAVCVFVLCVSCYVLCLLSGLFVSRVTGSTILSVYLFPRPISLFSGHLIPNKRMAKSQA